MIVREQPVTAARHANKQPPGNRIQKPIPDANKERSACTTADKQTESSVWIVCFNHQLNLQLRSGHRPVNLTIPFAASRN